MSPIELLILAAIVALIWWTAVKIGQSAERKGRSKRAWTGIAVACGIVFPVVGLLIPAIIVASWRVDAAR